MINAFQMNTAMTSTELRPAAGITGTTGSGEGMFSTLLNGLSSGQSVDDQSSGASLFNQASFTDMNSPGDTGSTLQAFLSSMNGSFKGASSLVNRTVSSDGTVSVSSRKGAGVSDLLMSESDLPHLVSFLQDKGFSTEEIDSMVLSSRNEDGLIDIDKLVKAMKSAGTGELSDDTGLSVDAAFVPKVQELLFNMGMGVGEVREIIEESKEDSGGISLDKLTGAVNEQTQATVTKTEMVSMLEQNNITLTSSAQDTSPAALSPEDNARLNGQPSFDAGDGSASLSEGLASRGQFISGMNRATAAQTADAGAESAVSADDPDILSLRTDMAEDPDLSDTDPDAIELKREFMDFLEGKTRPSGETAAQNTASQDTAAQKTGVSSDKTVATSDMESLESTQDEEAIARLSRAVTGESTQETSSLNQALRGQAQWQKGDQERVIDILKGENQLNARAEARIAGQGQQETMKDSEGFLKQEDQGQDILSGGDKNSATTGAVNAETAEFKDSLLNIDKAQSIDTTSQNMTRIAEDVSVKTGTKGVYNLPDPIPRVFERMVVMVRNGEQTGRLMIQPPELGKIDIDLSVKDGHVQANLTTENIAVKEIIEANLNQLKQQFNSQGLVIEQFNVSVGSQGRQFMENFGQGWNQGYGSSGSGDSGTEEMMSGTDEGTSGDTQSSRYRIDVRV